MYIGIDVGGTSVRIVCWRSLSGGLPVSKVVFPNLPDFGENQRRIVETIRSLGTAVDGIGMGAPGRLDNRKTTIISATYLPQWINQPIGKTLIKEFHCPVIIDNDSLCAALGEAMYGQESREGFHFLNWGTGINGAVVTYPSGKLHIHRITRAEHRTYFRPWQEACGGQAIREYFSKSPADLSDSEWLVAKDLMTSPFLKFIEDFRPRKVIFGGGVVLKQWPYFQSVFAQLQDSRSEWPKSKIEKAILGEDAGLYGALGLLRSKDFSYI